MQHDQRSIPARQNVRISPSLCFGPDHFVVAAGPCAVEGRDQLEDAARIAASAGAAMLRGGAFKPRTSPQSFQGLGTEGLLLLSEVSRATGLPVVTEVLDPRDVELVGQHAALLQIGSRNMQNFPLLREVGRLGAPVLLKRGAAATIDELLGAADYILEEGNTSIVLCERGIRSFDPGVRFTLDLTAVPRLQARSPLPVIVDPSHGTGVRSLVQPMARAALAAGADGLLIELHPHPEQALSDGPQALTPEDFRTLMAEIERWIPPTARKLARAPESQPYSGQERAEARAT